MKMQNFLKSILKTKPKTSNLAEEIKKIERMKEEIRMAKAQGKKEAHKKPKEKKEGKKIGSIFSEMASNLDSWEKSETDMFEPTIDKKPKKKNKKQKLSSKAEELIKPTLKEGDGISPTF